MYTISGISIVAGPSEQPDNLLENHLRPISVLTLWISEGLTQS